MPLTPRPGILGIEPYKAGLSKAKGKKKVIKLSSNETPLGPSPEAIRAYKKAGNKLLRYPDSAATPLREAIGRTHGLNPESIICGAGSDELISLLCLAYAGPGDEVIYSQYGFLMYPIATMTVGATPVIAPESSALITDVDAVLGQVTARTRIVFIANPNNPTGSYLCTHELLRLRKGLPDNVLLVLDGAYAEYVSNADYSPGQDIVDMGDNTVMLRTFSKIYGLASLRIGWAYCPPSVIDILDRVRGPFNLSTPAIMAGIAAVEDSEHLALAKAHNDRWLPWLSGELTTLGLKVYPSVGNFILVEFPKGKHNAEAANHYLMDNGVIVRAMGGYKLPDCLRITIGSESENKEVVKLLREFLGQ